jgi:hypothetical protein
MASLPVLQMPCTPLVDNLGYSHLHQHVWTSSSSMMDPPNLNLYHCLTTSTSRWTVERLSLHTLDACLHFDLYHDLPHYHHYYVDPSDIVVCKHTTTSNHLTNNEGQSPPTILRANLPHHNSLQSALDVLGQGTDLEERLAKVKLWEG